MVAELSREKHLHTIPMDGKPLRASPIISPNLAYSSRNISITIGFQWIL